MGPVVWTLDICLNPLKRFEVPSLDQVVGANYPGTSLDVLPAPFHRAITTQVGPVIASLMEIWERETTEAKQQTPTLVQIGWGVATELCVPT